MAPQAGILYVTMQPKPSLLTPQFHDWYNNEHGPGRLRLPFVKNGFRYRASDEEEPEWMAVYDITDMEKLTTEQYTRLRKAPVQSQRERDTMAQITVDRKFFDLLTSRQAKEFKELESVEAEGSKNVLIAVHFTVQPGTAEVLGKWYEEEHTAMLSKVPGWLRTRRFVTSSLEPKEDSEYVALHEFHPVNGLGGEEFQAAVSTPWMKDVYKNVVKTEKKRRYDLYYTFGPAPRDISAVSTKEAITFNSSDNSTRTIPASAGGPAIESYVTTSDGAVLPYRLEGSTDPSAPLIVLVNSVLVEWGIWDAFVAKFLADPKNQQYRILRYHARGRSSNTGSINVTLDVLSSDVVALLDALRVQKAAAIIGVSLGGATVLNTALQYPQRVAAFISCDTNAMSPQGNKKAWGDRIAVAKSEAATSPSGEKVVGDKLAEMTVRRWFVNDDGKKEDEIQRIKKMVHNNSLEGFQKGVEALFQYDLRDQMKTSGVKGAFVVGSGDGVLPAGMKSMAEDYGGGKGEYKVIESAGHLPMAEKPDEFTEFATEFLTT